mmetsp:Transcript_48519/g.140564  ORF Transcript_48519/g.140564 Transcript_48519/m.140564 type:complete len:219 (-) Transcript_48519:357-1013(-)
MAVFRPTSWTCEPGSMISSMPSPAAAMPAAPAACSDVAEEAAAAVPAEGSFFLGVMLALGSQFSFEGSAVTPEKSMGMRFSCFTRKSCPLTVALTSKRCVSSWHSTTRARQPLSSMWFRSPRMATCVPTVSGSPFGASGTKCSPLTFSVSGSETEPARTTTSYLSFLTFATVATNPLNACCLPFSPTSTTSERFVVVAPEGEGTDSFSSSSAVSTSTW